jgi:hypothetical protein
MSRLIILGSKIHPWSLPWRLKASIGEEKCLPRFQRNQWLSKLPVLNCLNHRQRTHLKVLKPTVSNPMMTNPYVPAEGEMIKGEKFFNL